MMIVALIEYPRIVSRTAIKFALMSNLHITKQPYTMHISCARATTENTPAEIPPIFLNLNPI